MILCAVFPVYQRSLLMLMALALLAGCAASPDLSRDDWPTTVEPAPLDPEANHLALQFRQVFERYQGTPYRYGGTDASGFDCSGFILTAYREALGQRLPRTTEALLAQGSDIPRDAIRPGDLVFFRIAGKDSHAGIYVGDHRFIHSASSSGVTLSSLRSDYWRARYSQARRFD